VWFKGAPTIPSNINDEGMQVVQKDVNEAEIMKRTISWYVVTF
jgi:hypothetical protein